MKNIVISVLGREGDRIRIGIEAPRSVPIRRSELAPVPNCTGQSTTALLGVGMPAVSVATTVVSG